MKYTLVCLLFLAASSVLGNTARAESRPANIIIIVSDDQRYDQRTQRFMPATSRRLFDEGLNFTGAYVTTPACCPSRSSIMTGMYASTHGVKENDFLLLKPTLFERLPRNMFYTGLIGKYLNTWSGEPRSEFDYWVSFAGGNSRYKNPRLNVNGQWRDSKGYITYLFRDYAQEFIHRAQKENKPFLLYLAFNSPHYPYVPAAGDEKRYLDLPVPRPPSYMEEDLSDKPLWLRRIKKKRPDRIAMLDEIQRRQWQMLWSVDKSVEAIIATLESYDILERTVIFFISDNGLFAGEHQLASKDAVYEEAIHVPFAVRCPAIFGAGQRSELVANIDIAPTIFELAGQEVPGDLDGLSLLRLKDSSFKWRTDLLIEGYRSRKTRAQFAAVHTGRFVYVMNNVDVKAEAADYLELYDLKTDPFQLNNRISDGTLAEARVHLAKRLNEILTDKRGAVSFELPQGKRGTMSFENEFSK